MKQEIQTLLDEQLSSWEMARNNYDALKQVRVKELEVNGCHYKVQFNPARIVSSAAKVDAKSIQERKCFLCPANLPPMQQGIPFNGHYQILVNPFPIFPKHLTVPELEHVDQRILMRFGDMLDLAKSADDYVVFYNGPKCGASAPDHAHFQAGNKGFLTIETEWQRKKEEKVVELPGGTLWALDDYPRTTLVIEATDKVDAMTLFRSVYDGLTPLAPSPKERGDKIHPELQEEPMMNVITWAEGDKWIVCIFPRDKHRPSCYTAEGDANILISPASVDMGGVFITPLEKDFEEITASDIADILSEVCMNPADFKKLKESLTPLTPSPKERESKDTTSIYNNDESKLTHTSPLLGRGVGGEAPQVHVGIMFEPQIEFVLRTPFGIEGEKVTGKQTATYSDGQILWNGRLYDGLLFEPLDLLTASFELLDVTIGINFHWERKEDQRFQGALKIIVEEGKLTGINVINVEDYLTSVISSEMSATASLELLKAHAVISRSWLLANSGLTPNPSPKERGERDLLSKEEHYETADKFSYRSLKEKQKELKKNPTEAESIIWERIRDEQLGHKFRRQHIIDNYIVDFVCIKQKLIVEIDGAYHFTTEQKIKDAERTEHLSALGYTILRFTNDEVITSSESVLNAIASSPLLGRGVGGEAVIRWYERDAHTRFDVCADDHCQRYQGITRASTDIVRQAIAATRGQVLMSEGKICDARFSKCCGGAFEEFQYCWEDVKHPYLAKQRDSKTQTEFPDLHIEAEAEKWIRTSPEAFCNTKDKKVLAQVLNNYDQETTDFYRWKVEYTQQELSELIKQRSGIDYGEIIDVIPVARGTSGRMWKLKIVGSKRTLTIGKELEIRRTLSTSHLYSSAFVIDKAEIQDGVPGRFILTGAGWGHGVGLCQIGAAVMGEQGYKYDEILLHYYHGQPHSPTSSPKERGSEDTFTKIVTLY